MLDSSPRTAATDQTGASDEKAPLWLKTIGSLSFLQGSRWWQPSRQTVGQRSEHDLHSLSVFKLKLNLQLQDHIIYSLIISHRSYRRGFLLVILFYLYLPLDIKAHSVLFR